MRRFAVPLPLLGAACVACWRPTATTATGPSSDALAVLPARTPHFLPPPFALGSGVRTTFGGARPLAPAVPARPFSLSWPFSFGTNQISSSVDPTWAPMFVMTMAMHYPALLNRNLLYPFALLVLMTGGL
jgi:hypothetical protein